MAAEACGQECACVISSWNLQWLDIWPQYMLRSRADTLRLLGSSCWITFAIIRDHDPRQDAISDPEGCDWMGGD